MLFPNKSPSLFLIPANICSVSIPLYARPFLRANKHVPTNWLLNDAGTPLLCSILLNSAVFSNTADLSLIFCGRKYSMYSANVLSFLSVKTSASLPSAIFQTLILSFAVLAKMATIFFACAYSFSSAT